MMIKLLCNNYLHNVCKLQNDKLILRSAASLFTFNSSNYGTSSHLHYDCIISGGGMVGFSMACVLGRSTRMQGKKILLLERAPKKSWTLSDTYSNRVCALSKNTKKFFIKLGIWEKILSFRAQPVKYMQVWEGCSEANIQFDKCEENDPLAHIVENDIILNSIKSQIPDTVEILYEADVSSYEFPLNISSKANLTLSTGDAITTDLLIGADGINSLVRKTMNSQYLNWEYDQMGIVATLKLSEEYENVTAWQRFLPTGPIALLPLDDKHCSLVWSTTKEQARILTAMSEQDFVDSVNGAFWNENHINKTVRDIHQKWMDLITPLFPNAGGGIHQLPPGVEQVLPQTRAAFPLGLGHSVHYIAPRVALIGDAAHRVHPLAGQGVNIGFGDVNCLAKTIENTIMLGKDIGDDRELQKYESDRQQHNIAVMSTIEGLYRLYSTSLTPVVVARSIGLSFVNACYPVKKQLMKYADG